MMRAFVADAPNTPLREAEFEIPTPSGREVVLRVTHSGVCHTDTHSHAGGYDLGSAGFLSITSRGLEYPAVWGHEMVGEVVAVGPDAENVEVGDSRIIYPWAGCGDCRRCDSGHTNLCTTSRALGVFRWGGFATHVLVSDSKFLVDHTGLDAGWAATLACSGLTAYSSAKKALPLSTEETVAVIGAGGVGLSAIALLSHLTDARVVAVDVSSANLSIASELGADVCIDSSELGDQSLADALGAPVDAVIDFVNNGSTFTLAFNSLAKGGTLVPVGLFGGEAPIAPVLISLKALSIIGNYVGTLDELTELVGLAQSTDLPKVPLDRRPLSLEAASTALDQLVEGKVSGRIILEG